MASVSDTSEATIRQTLDDLEKSASQALYPAGIGENELETFYQIDIRYRGQGMKLTIDISPEDFNLKGLQEVTSRFDDEHEKLFTFALDAEHELVGLRAIVQGGVKDFVRNDQSSGDSDPAPAQIEPTRLFAEGTWHDGMTYDRGKLRPGNRIPGSAIILEMDSTTVILPDHFCTIDEFGNIIIWPENK